MTKLMTFSMEKIQKETNSIPIRKQTLEAKEEKERRMTLNLKIIKGIRNRQEKDQEKLLG